MIKTKITAMSAAMPNIMPVWQPLGYSTHQIATSVAAKYRRKTTHTGVLDPMAEGVVIMLLGDERFKKMEHTSWLKEYEFEVLFGVSTDSYDGLGFPTKTDFDKSISAKNLEKTLGTFVGPYSQKVPLFSAQKVAGRKLYTYPALELETPELPVKVGKIHEIKLVEFSKKKLHRSIGEILEKILQVKRGEFRQSAVQEKWKVFLSETQDTEVVTARIKVVITRGMYIRSLCKDIGDKLGVPSFVTSLVRTKNGPYSKENCGDLDAIFGKSFNHDLLASQYANLFKL